MIVHFLSLLVSTCSTNFEAGMPNPQNKKTGGMFDDIQKGLQQTMDDMKN